MMSHPAFEVCPFTEERFFQFLSNDKFGPAEVAEHGRAKYLSHYLRDIGAQSIVLEHDYTDGDYLAAGLPAACHSENPSLYRLIANPFVRSVCTASKDKMQYGPRQ